MEPRILYRVSAYVGYWTDQSNTTSIILGSLDINKDQPLAEGYKVYQNFPIHLILLQQYHTSYPKIVMLKLRYMI